MSASCRPCRSGPRERGQVEGNGHRVSACSRPVTSESQSTDGKLSPERIGREDQGSRGATLGRGFELQALSYKLQVPSLQLVRGCRAPLQGAALRIPLDDGVTVTAFLFRGVDQDSWKGCTHRRPALAPCHCPADWPEQAYDPGDPDGLSVAAVQGWCRRCNHRVV